MVLLNAKHKCVTASVNTDSQCRKQESCFARATQVWLPSITTPVSHQANELDVKLFGSELHGPVGLAAVNQIVCCS